MKCYDCDTELLEKWNYCPNCGEGVEENECLCNEIQGSYFG